ncbi:hypothetical protein HHL21_03870 [Massilia sp. RP-1-19]|uniref:Uncharacterized protein n=1 Tax=Massilia polaris TaxID=2728846 RepID=A0A848HFL2_9BURK|nr:hypothetical protein [Massilia polaris]NML60235.1 hypothetical protein [Massilia polaris]
MKAFLVLMAFAVHAAAADTSPAPAMKNIQGVYKERFMNGHIGPGDQTGKKDTFIPAENILEIVRYNDEHIYFRVRRHYYNGPICSLYGMARHEGASFVFRDPEEGFEGRERCTLTITPSADEITLNDRVSTTSGSTCWNHCGVNASLSDISVPMKLRRPIRYMERILNSRQYKQAVEQLAEPQAGE